MKKYHVQNYVFAILFVFNFAIQANTITVHFAVSGVYLETLIHTVGLEYHLQLILLDQQPQTLTDNLTTSL